LGNFGSILTRLRPISKSQTVRREWQQGQNYLSTQKKIAFVGVSNLLFVETEEGILIADPKYTNEIRKVTEWSEQLTDSFNQNSTN